MENIISGFFIINKPIGITSHDVIDKLRIITSIKKIGHAGTLDPFASGVLIVAIGRESTREISKFVKLDKEYIADIFLGAETDTYDRTGVKIFKKSKFTNLSKKKIEEILLKFLGKQKQIPPMFSAKKVGGKKLYKLARKGIKIKREPENIEIFEIKLIKYVWPLLKIKIKCSSGTYIRSLAYDIGIKLGCGGYLNELERTAIGDFKISDALDIKKFKDEIIKIKDSKAVSRHNIKKIDLD